MLQSIVFPPGYVLIPCYLLPIWGLAVACGKAGGEGLYRGQPGSEENTGGLRGAAGMASGVLKGLSTLSFRGSAPQKMTGLRGGVAGSPRGFWLEAQGTP